MRGTRFKREGFAAQSGEGSARVGLFGLLKLIKYRNNGKKILAAMLLVAEFAFDGKPRVALYR